ncbi:MAG: sugar phosphate isomerase/epimerase [Chloroflexi bacterium]|nr:sugar phosphate isomerase/epimerase [Chloroflexota bacterium]
MKKGLVICGPDVAWGPLALLSGTFEEKVLEAVSLGYDGCELMVRDPSRLDWGAIKRTLETAGLAVPQIVTGELFGADGLVLVTADVQLRSRAEQRLCSVIDMAAYFNAMVNIGRVRGRLDLLNGMENAWEFATQQLRRIAHYARTKNVRIVLEPINRYESDFINNASDGMRAIEELECDNVGLMLDLFHMNIEDASIEQGLLSAGDKLWHVHIADSNRRYPGSGHLDFNSIFATLKDMGFQGYISAELIPFPDPDVAAQKTIELLKRCEKL